MNAAPAEFFGLKSYLCCGKPCYTKCAVPFLYGVKDGKTFASAMKYAVNAYQEKHFIPQEQRAIFDHATEDLFFCNFCPSLFWDVKKIESAVPKSLEMTERALFLDP